MAELERLIRATFDAGAGYAPGTGELIAVVHRRSRRLRWRRRIATGGVGVAILLTAVVAVPAVAGTWWPARDPVAGPVRTGPAPTSAPAATSSDPAATPSASPATSTAGDERPVRLVAPAFDVPVFPYRPNLSATAFEPPVVTLDRGRLIAHYFARDPVRGADVTFVVSPDRPDFGDLPNGPVTESPSAVRQHPGTLRTIAVSPAASLTLYWQESPGRWIQVRSDDTFTVGDLVRFAERLDAGTLPIDSPGTLDLAPAGLVLDTLGPSGLALRHPGVPASADRARKLTVRLSIPTALTGATVAVGRHRGTIARTGAEVSLTVDRTDQQLTLTVTVPAAIAISDTDLIRFAAGITLTERAEPA